MVWSCTGRSLFWKNKFERIDLNIPPPWCKQLHEDEHFEVAQLVSGASSAAANKWVRRFVVVEERVSCMVQRWQTALNILFFFAVYGEEN